MDLGLSGRRALVTGSYRGTGAGIAKVLAAEGCHVLVHGFEIGQPDSVVAEIAAAGGSAEAVVADIATDSGTSALAPVIAELDILVNNYGTPVGSDWHTLANWDDEWNRNVLTGIRVTQLCLPTMRERGWGRVIFIGTVGTQRPGSNNPGYYGAKTALTSLVRTLAMELRGSGVTANLVSPGMIATVEVRETFSRRAARAGVGPNWADVERWATVHSMPNLTGRIPDPVDVGRLVALVASEVSWPINGADLAVDGGLP